MSNCDINLQQQFVAEIDYQEIEIEEVVGKGSFGVVWKGKWRNRYVAVKHINTEHERKAFAVEVRQLSRVTHPNIVQLYGACTKNPVCLIMEYAEGGSLYNVLHGDEPLPQYTAAHAMSWALQCAQGVAYLHNMKPKPLIHRDLKPPNLLLILGGQTLKICDFGTACDLNTYMTNNKGSAAWMAPEVFEGSRYTEKCDVFSWGIILWEIISRKKPFDEIGGSAYRIMWAVHLGQRPPLIENCPEPIENLMTRCWKKEPEERPSMSEVVEIMSRISEFFSNQLEPVEYSSSTDDKSQNYISDTLGQTDDLSLACSFTDNGFEELPEQPKRKLVVVEQNDIDIQPVDPFGFMNTKTNNVTFSDNMKERGQNMSMLHIECDSNAWAFDKGWDQSYMSDTEKQKMQTDNSTFTSNEDLDNVYQLLDAELRPVSPDYTCIESIKIFEEHKLLAQEYLRVQTEIALLDQNKIRMTKNVDEDNFKQESEIANLNDEKEALEKLHKNMKMQLEIMENQRTNAMSRSLQVAPSRENMEWILVQNKAPTNLLD